MHYANEINTKNDEIVIQDQISNKNLVLIVWMQFMY